MSKSIQGQYFGTHLVALFLLSLVAPLIFSGATAEDWKSSPTNLSTLATDASIHSGVYSPGNAFDSDWDTFSLLEANRCDGGSSDCQEEGQPYAELSFRFPVSENTTAIDFHLQAVLHDGGSPPEGSLAIIECEHQFQAHTYWQINSTNLQAEWDSTGGVNELGWTQTADVLHTVYLPVRIPISTEPSVSECSANDEGEIFFRVYTTHAGNTFESDETAIYLYEVKEVCEGCTIPCESNDFGLGEDASNSFIDEWDGTILMRGIEVVPGKNDFTGWADEFGDDVDLVWFFVPLGYTAMIQLQGIEEHSEQYSGCSISTSGNDFDLFIIEWDSWDTINSSTSYDYPETVTTNSSSSGKQVVLGISAYDGAGPYEIEIWLLPGLDSDGDGVPDIGDSFPLDGSEWLDTDGDRIGNNADLDDDGDNWDDADEYNCGSDPLDSLSFPSDPDGDGLCSALDSDYDNDGVFNWDDAFPNDSNESIDTDGDGIGNNADEDDDGDGVPDSDDDYPLDSSQHQTGDCQFDSINRIGHVSYYTYPLGGSTSTQINTYPQSAKDWDLDGFDNSVDFFPIDVSRAAMPACGNSFGLLSPNPSYHIDHNSISSIDGLVVVDWDKDGDYDIIIGGTSSKTEYYGIVMGIENLGNGTFAPPVNMKNLGSDTRVWVPSLYGDVDEIALMDLHGDGSNLGLIVGAQSWTRYYTSPNPAWSELDFYREDENPWADDDIETQRARDIIVADINNDGKHDWAISYRFGGSYDDGWVPRVEVFDNSYIYSRPVGTKIETGESKYHINWFDADSDGTLDLLMCKIRCQIFDTQGVTEKWSYFASDAIWTSAWTDFDKDGDYDLAIGGADGKISIFQMHNGILPDEPTIVLSNGVKARSLHWADIDGDGWQDLLVGNDGKDRIFSNEEGYLSLAWESSSSKLTNYIMTADIDLDGDLDIIGSDVSSVFIIINEPDEDAAYHAALDRLSTPYVWLSTILGSILVLRSLSLLYGWQNKFLLVGLLLFALAGSMWFELANHSIAEPRDGDGWNPLVSECGYNEDCVAARWLENSTFFSTDTEGLDFHPSSESSYSPIGWTLMLMPIFGGLLAILSLVKHHRKTNFVTGNGPTDDEHSEFTISSLSAVSYFIAIAALFYPASGNSGAISVIVFFVFAIIGFVLRRKKNSPGAIAETTSFRKDPKNRTIATGFWSWLNLSSPLFLVVAILFNWPLGLSAKPKKSGRVIPKKSGRVIISQQQKNTRKSTRKCSRCGQTGHDKRTCPQKGKNKICSHDGCINHAGKSGYCGIHKPNWNYGLPDPLKIAEQTPKVTDPLVQAALESGRTPEDLIADLLDDGILNYSAGSDAVPNPEQETTKEYGTIQSSSDQIPKQGSEISSLKSLQSLEEWLSIPSILEATTDFSEVRRIHTEIGNVYLKTSQEGKEGILSREISILNELQSKNLGNLVPRIFFADENIPLLVLEQSGQMPLSRAMQTMNPSRKISILGDLAKDIRYLHNQGFVHRDIKPENITIGDVSSSIGERYHGLIDFGSVLRINRRQGIDLGGLTRTRFYGHRSQQESDFRAHQGQDWFSFARVAMCLITGELPPTLRSMIEGGSIESRINSDFDSQFWDAYFTRETVELIEKIIMLSCSPEGESNDGLDPLKELGIEIAETAA